AEDGIRDFHVTGVQTCALPIWRMSTKTLTSAEQNGWWVGSAAGAVLGPPADGVLVEPLRQVQPLEHELHRGRHRAGGGFAARDLGHDAAERRDLADQRGVAVRGHVLTGLHRAALLERVDHGDEAL